MEKLTRQVLNASPNAVEVSGSHAACRGQCHLEAIRWKDELDRWINGLVICMAVCKGNGKGHTQNLQTEVREAKTKSENYEVSLNWQMHLNCIRKPSLNRNSACWSNFQCHDRFPQSHWFFVILTHNFNLAKRWQRNRTAFMSRWTAAIKINEFKINLECACECKIQTNEQKPCHKPVAIFCQSGWPSVLFSFSFCLIFLIYHTFFFCTLVCSLTCSIALLLVYLPVTFIYFVLSSHLNFVD